MTRDETERLLRLRLQLTHEQLNDQTIAAWHLALESVTYEDARAAMTKAAAASERVGLFALNRHLPNVPRQSTPPQPTAEDRERRGERLHNGDHPIAQAAVTRGIAATWTERLLAARMAGSEMVARLDRWTRADKTTSAFAAWAQTQLHPPIDDTEDEPA